MRRKGIHIMKEIIVLLIYILVERERLKQENESAARQRKVMLLKSSS